MTFARVVLDDWCDLCDRRLPTEELRPRKIVTRFMQEIPEGSICIDQETCTAVVAERNRQAEHRRLENAPRYDADVYLTDEQRAAIDYC